MTIKEFYEIACKNNIENWEIALHDGETLWLVEEYRTDKAANLVVEKFKIGDVVKYVGSNYKLLKKTGVVVCLIGSNKVRILFEDEEKALDIEADDLILKSYLNKLSENYPQTFDEAINELSTGIQVALKNESEPMQVLNEKYDKGDIDYSGNCPKCGDYLIREYNKKYCGACGQNLRWSEHNSKIPYYQWG